MTRIRKAIFPVAGLGTRFLPATKAMAKFYPSGMLGVGLTGLMASFMFRID